MLQLLMPIDLLFHGIRLARRLPPRAPRANGDAGQSTAEYALVLLGAASIALLLVAWATKTGKITDLLDGVVDEVIGKVG